MQRQRSPRSSIDVYGFGRRYLPKIQPLVIYREFVM